jgi:hypothetical protein
MKVDKKTVAHSVREEMVKTIHYKHDRFQVLDCSGTTSNRLYVKVIPFANKRTYVELNHVLVMDLARFQTINAVLPMKEENTIQVKLEDSSPILLDRCTPAMFAEAMSQLAPHFAAQPELARNEISSVIDCYQYETPGSSLTRTGQRVISAPPAPVRPRESFWRRLRR